MSFGVGIGDFVNLAQLAREVYKQCCDSPGQYRELAKETFQLAEALGDFQHIQFKGSLSFKKQLDLAQRIESCVEVLTDLKQVLCRSKRLGTNTRRLKDRIAWDQQHARDLRMRILLSLAMLSSFSNTLHISSMLDMQKALRDIQSSIDDAHDTRVQWRGNAGILTTDSLRSELSQRLKSPQFACSKIQQNIEAGDGELSDPHTGFSQDNDPISGQPPVTNYHSGSYDPGELSFHDVKQEHVVPPNDHNLSLPHFQDVLIGASCQSHHWTRIAISERQTVDRGPSPAPSGMSVYVDALEIVEASHTSQNIFSTEAATACPLPAEGVQDRVLVEAEEAYGIAPLGRQGFPARAQFTFHQALRFMEDLKYHSCALGSSSSLYSDLINILDAHISGDLDLHGVYGQGRALLAQEPILLRWFYGFFAYESYVHSDSLGDRSAVRGDNTPDDLVDAEYRLRDRQGPLLDDAVAFLNRVKATSATNPRTYSKFLEIISAFKNSGLSTPEVCVRVGALLASKPALLKDFACFLPDGYLIEDICDPVRSAIRVTIPLGISPLDDSARVLNRSPMQTAEEMSALGRWQRALKARWAGKMKKGKGKHVDDPV